MNAKILFTDMDGTLLRNDSTVSCGMKAALDSLILAGHKLVLTSGRPLDSILEVMQAADLFYPDTLVIAYNGSLIYDCNSRSPLAEHRVPMHAAASIIQCAKRHGLHVQTYTDHEIVCAAEDEEVRYYRRRIHLPLLLSSDLLSALDKPPYKVHVIHLTDKRKLEAFKHEIDASLGDLITVQFSNDQYLEFYSREAGKGNAILEACRHFGIQPENCVAAGDAPNDLSMLAAAGCGVAMANAAEDVKKAASFITQKDNEHDGLIEAIEALFPGV